MGVPIQKLNKTFLSWEDDTDVATATVPIVVERATDPDRKNRAFLPVIERYATENGDLHLTVLYLDVPGVARKEESPASTDRVAGALADVAPGTVPGVVECRPTPPGRMTGARARSA